jgi:hypothetical protein
MSTASSPLNKSGEPITWNFKLLSQNDLGGFGGMGEGMSVQIAKDGRRIIWLAHESAPKNFTGVDVSDPRKPKVVVQTDLPKPYMRSNSLELSGDIMAVAYQTQKVNQQPAGLELFDVSVPEKPRSISFLDCSGANSRGVHQLWFCDGEYVHMASGAPDFVPSHPNDDQFYQCIDVRNPSKPVEIGRWWMPGTKKGETPLPRHKLDKGYRAKKFAAPALHSGSHARRGRFRSNAGLSRACASGTRRLSYLGDESCMKKCISMVGATVLCVCTAVAEEVPKRRRTTLSNCFDPSFGTVVVRLPSPFPEDPISCKVTLAVANPRLLSPRFVR